MTMKLIEDWKDYLWAARQAGFSHGGIDRHRHHRRALGLLLAVLPFLRPSLQLPFAIPDCGGDDMGRRDAGAAFRTRNWTPRSPPKKGTTDGVA